MRRIRVVHCLETVSSGGVEQRRLSLARLLDPARYEQRLICTAARGPLPDQFREAGCEVIPLGKMRHIAEIGRYRQAARLLREFAPDIVHGAVFGGVAVAAIAGRMAGVPVIIGEETSDPTNRRWRGHILYRALTTLTHRMVAISPAVEAYLVDRLRIPRTKVTLITNGVRDPGPSNVAAREAARLSLGLDASDCIIVTTGRLHDGHKRVSDIIRAIALLRSRLPVKLIVVGTGPDREQLEALTRNEQVADAVHFVGYQAQPRLFLDIADMFVLASAREGFGLVLVEAMFAGLPVIATAVGGIPNVVDNGETGILVPPASPEALATAIVRLHDDRALRQNLAMAGKAAAQRQFTAERYVADVDALYTRMLA
ncbi:MAG: glycosyltransferase [Oxalobacteraceae bacterium]|nr:MAG: glycosyltransferase [Oxalobacteraceae bacterium]